MTAPKTTVGKSGFFEQDSFLLIGDTGWRQFPSWTKKYLEKRAKRVLPVDLAGKGGYPTDVATAVKEVSPPLPKSLPDAAIIEVDKERTAEVVRQVLDLGVRSIWIHQMTETPEAIDLAREADARLETGGCAVMYLAPSTSMHALHRGIWKLLKKY